MSRATYRALVLLLAWMAVGANALAASDSSRLALVVGNAAYADAPLQNPVNDATAMSAKLGALGFDVTTVLDADRTTLEQSIVEFAARLEADSTALFYYAGHGLQVRGHNYLVPVDAEFARENEVRIAAVDIDLLLSELEWAGNKINIVILDACRNNPFERRFRGSKSRGLAAVDAARGTLIAYATAPGSVAADGAGDNGLYTQELLKALDEPGLGAEAVFKRVRIGVADSTRDQQIPWESSSLTGDFVFNQVASEPEPVQVATAAPASAGASSEADALFWESVKDSEDPGDFQLYLDSFPEGLFAGLARSRMAKVQRSAARAVRQDEPAPAKPRVGQLLAMADADIVALRLTSPPGNNAVERLREVLGLEPDNAHAHAALARVVARYLELADKSAASGAFDRAESYVDRAEKVSPGSETIGPVRERLADARARAAAALAARGRADAEAAAARDEADRARASRASEEAESLAALRAELDAIKRQQAQQPAAPGSAPDKVRVVIMPARVGSTYSAAGPWAAVGKQIKALTKVLQRSDAVELVFSPADSFGGDPEAERRLDRLWTSSVASPEIDVERAASALAAKDVDVAIALFRSSQRGASSETTVFVLDVATRGLRRERFAGRGEAGRVFRQVVASIEAGR